MAFRGIIRASVLITLSLLLCVSSAMGFGREGHRIVGGIAASYLNENAKAAVADLLDGSTLSDVSTWADDVKYQPAYSHTKPLHYVNMPFGDSLVVMNRDCPDDECVIAAITENLAVLQDQNAPQVNRVEALRFLVHFVADVHQPLHVSYAQDRGGSTVDVTFFGSSTWSLHSVWDTGLLNHMSLGDWVATAIRVRSEITDVELTAYRASSDPLDWAHESGKITYAVYQELLNGTVIGQNYFETYIGTIEDRLAAAGVRLAMLLNNTFSVVPDTPDAEVGALFVNLSGVALLTGVRELTESDHNNLGYRSAREALYWQVDNSDGVVVTIYDHRPIALPPGEWPSQYDINCEHTWPKSMGAGSDPAKSDLHHLRPAIPNINSTRGNLPYGTPVGTLDHDYIWKVGREPDGDKVFQPPPDVRGDIARGMFYFSVRYQMPIDADQEEDLRQWHEDDPVDASELARMRRIEQEQGNTNPFVIDPTLVSRLGDF